jgi:acetoin utilization protein AcuB
MRVSDVMSREVVTIKESDSCHEAVARMSRGKIRHLPVVGSDGALVGIVTDRDVRHHLFRPTIFNRIGSVPVESLLTAMRVRDIMSAPVVTVGSSDDLEVAARLMREGKIGSLPVVEQGQLAGIITETDVLRRIVSADACCCADVEEIIVSYP